MMSSILGSTAIVNIVNKFNTKNIPKVVIYPLTEMRHGTSLCLKWDYYIYQSNMKVFMISVLGKKWVITLYTGNIFLNT